MKSNDYFCFRTVGQINKFLIGAHKKYKNLRFKVDEENSGMTGQIGVDAPHGSTGRLETVWRLSDLKRDHAAQGLIEKVTFNIDLHALDGEGVGEAFAARNVNDDVKVAEKASSKAKTEL